MHINVFKKKNVEMALPLSQNKRKKKKEKFELFPTLVLIALWIWCIWILFLVVWALFTACKSFIQFDVDPLGIPNISKYPIFYPSGEKGLSGFANFFTNFVAAMKYMSQSAAAKINGKNVSFAQLLMNSLLFCFGTPFFAVVTGLMYSYIVARFRRYKFINLLFYFVILRNFIPSTENAGTSMYLLKLFGLYDNMFGWWLWCAGPLGFFIMFYASWVGIPKEYEEAAMVDGAGHFTIFFRIMLPNNLVIPTITYLSSVISHWTNYTTPIMYLPSWPSVAFVAYKFQFDNNGSADVNYLTIQIAALMLVSLPMFFPVLYMQKKMKKMKFNVVGIKG